ncbi:MAG: hypothetical protein ABR586_01300 [Thermoplasmatota archaeon]
MSGITYRSNRQNLKSASVGQVSDQPLTFPALGAGNLVTVGAASSVLIMAAAAGVVGPNVWITVPASADTGIRVNFGAAADANSFLLGPGTYILPTSQEIRALRAGAADVVCSVMRASA